MGAWWLQQQQGYFLSGDPKVVWSLAVWSAYLILLILHWRPLAGGRRFAYGVIGVFAFVLLTFWSTNLPSAIHNP